MHVTEVVSLPSSQGVGTSTRGPSLRGTALAVALAGIVMLLVRATDTLSAVTEWVESSAALADSGGLVGPWLAVRGPLSFEHLFCDVIPIILSDTNYESES